MNVLVTFLITREKLVTGTEDYKQLDGVQIC